MHFWQDCMDIMNKLQIVWCFLYTVSCPDIWMRYWCFAKKSRKFKTVLLCVWMDVWLFLCIREKFPSLMELLFIELQMVRCIRKRNKSYVMDFTLNPVKCLWDVRLWTFVKPRSSPPPSQNTNRWNIYLEKYYSSISIFF